MENKTVLKEEPIIFKPEMEGLKGEFLASIIIIIIGVILGIITYFFAPQFLMEILLKEEKIPKYNSYYSFIIAFLPLLGGISEIINLKLTVKYTKYTLNSQRLVIEKGFISKKISNLELWRVIDTELKQNFLDNITGCCQIILATKDFSDDIIYLKGLEIKKGRELYETINDYVSQAMKKSGITNVV